MDTGGPGKRAVKQLWCGGVCMAGHIIPSNVCAHRHTKIVLFLCCCEVNVLLFCYFTILFFFVTLYMLLCYKFVIVFSSRSKNKSEKKLYFVYLFTVPKGELALNLWYCLCSYIRHH